MGFGEIAAWMPGMKDPIAEIKEVIYRPSTATDTIRVGDIVCFNTDATTDHEEQSSNPSSLGVTYAEGAQSYTGRLLIVEKPASGNMHHPAIVASLGPLAGADGDRIQVYVLKAGSIVPVYTNANCTLDATALGVASGSYLAQAVTGDGDPLPIGVAVETVDRSGTNGLVWCRLFGVAGVGQKATYFAPVRSSATSGREYGVKISGDDFFIGTTAAQSYLLELSGDKETVSTGDAYSAYLHIAGSNYAANDSNYTYRGLNCAISNRSGGTLGQIYGGNISISLKSGSGNITEGFALQIDAQDLSAGTKTNFGGLDVAINREGTAASGDDCGIRIRTRGTINSAINTAIKIAKDATDHGFVNLFSIEADGVDVAAMSGDKTFDTNDIAIPIVYNGGTYYLIASDSV